METILPLVIPAIMLVFFVWAVYSAVRRPGNVNSKTRSDQNASEGGYMSLFADRPTNNVGGEAMCGSVDCNGYPYGAGRPLGKMIER